jgi:hypothetical protein
MGCGNSQVSDAIDYAKFRSRSHNAVIRVYDEAGKCDQNARARGRFQRVVRLRVVHAASAFQWHARDRDFGSFGSRLRRQELNGD